MSHATAIESIAGMFGLDAAMDLLARAAAIDCPQERVAVVSFCDAATPRFDVRNITRAEAIAMAPFAACSLSIQPCDDVRHVLDVRCAGIDHACVASLRQMPARPEAS